MGAGPQFWRSDTALSFSLKAAGSLWLGHPRQRCSVVVDVWEQFFSEGEAAFPRLSLVRTMSGTPNNGKTVMKYFVTLAYAAGVCWEGTLQSVGTVFFQGVWGHIFLICTYSLQFYPFKVFLLYFFIVMGDIKFRVWCMNLNHSPVELHSLLLRYPL